MILGLQWAWQFNIIFQPVDLGFDSYCDHYIISMLNNNIITNDFPTTNELNKYIKYINLGDLIAVLGSIG